MAQQSWPSVDPTLRPQNGELPISYLGVQSVHRSNERYVRVVLKRPCTLHLCHSVQHAHPDPHVHILRGGEAGDTDAQPGQREREMMMMKEDGLGHSVWGSFVMQRVAAVTD